MFADKTTCPNYNRPARTLVMQGHNITPGWATQAKQTKTKPLGIKGLQQIFPDNDTARVWFEERRWPDGNRTCARCNSSRTYRNVNEKPQPYRCPDRRSYFSVKVGTCMENGNLAFDIWANAMYRVITRPKGTGALQLVLTIGAS